MITETSGAIALSLRNVSMPSRPGMMRSRRTTTGGSDATRSIAASPSEAMTASNPSATRILARAARASSSSSTTRTVGLATLPLEVVAPAALVDDLRSATRLFWFGRLLHLLRLVKLVRLLDLGHFLGLPGDVLGGLFRALDVAHHAPELETLLVGDHAPSLSCLSQRDDLVERGLLTQRWIALHQLLRKRRGDSRLSIAADATTKFGDNPRLDLELLRDPLGHAALSVGRVRSARGIGVELLGVRLELSLVLLVVLDVIGRHSHREHEDDLGHQKA